MPPGESRGIMVRVPQNLEHTESVSMCPGWLIEVLEFVQTASDLIGLGAMSIALLLAGAWWLFIEIRLLIRKADMERRASELLDIRLFLGTYILFGLEFMIVSDLIHSFLKPELTSLASLGALVVIRTVISFFLGRELESAAEAKARASAA